MTDTSHILGGAIAVVPIPATPAAVEDRLAPVGGGEANGTTWVDGAEVQDPPDGAIHNGLPDFRPTAPRPPATGMRPWRQMFKEPLS